MALPKIELLIRNPVLGSTLISRQKNQKWSNATADLDLENEGTKA